MSHVSTSNIMMVRPANFGFNEETAASNAFQTNDKSLTINEIQAKAKAEFDVFVDKLQSKGVNVVVVEDSSLPIKPDAIFPNNWISFHDNGAIITYPMYAEVRRLERSEAIIEQISSDFETGERHNLENLEAKNLYLEGTGSMILDRPQKLVYACISPRTDESVLDRFCEITNFDKVVFTAVDGGGQQIYHTNVMMAIGETFVVICLDTIVDADERVMVEQSILDSDKEVIEITLEQMMHFAGNMLQVRNESGETFLVMSEQAYKSLIDSQIQQIEAHTEILHTPLYTIETYGGGSARCMMAEIFLIKKVDNMDEVEA